jgi:hypothetical protein
VKQKKNIPKVAISSTSLMTLIEEFLAWKFGKPVLHRDVVHEVFFFKCDDQIAKRLLVTNTNNCFESNLHGQQARDYIPIY